jgi:hypothetical protein
MKRDKTKKAHGERAAAFERPPRKCGINEIACSPRKSKGPAENSAGPFSTARALHEKCEAVFVKEARQNKKLERFTVSV